MPAIRILYSRARVAWWLANWREVWAGYSTGRPMPPLRFRNGLVLLHGPSDDPMSLFWEVFSNGYYRAPIRPGEGSIVDVGANIGAASLYWAWRAPSVRIHAYEPNPPTMAILRANIDANNLRTRVQLFASAVAAHSGSVPLWNGPNSMHASTIAPAASSAASCLVVPAVSLAEVISRVEDAKVALLKIDAEGVESDMLERTPAECFRHVERVIVEYHDGLVPNALSRCRAALLRLGYRCSVRPIQRGPLGYGLIGASKSPRARVAS